MQLSPYKEQEKTGAVFSEQPSCVFYMVIGQSEFCEFLLRQRGKGQDTNQADFPFPLSHNKCESFGRVGQPFQHQRAKTETFRLDGFVAWSFPCFHLQWYDVLFPLQYTETCFVFAWQGNVTDSTCCVWRFTPQNKPSIDSWLQRLFCCQPRSETRSFIVFQWQCPWQIHQASPTTGRHLQLKMVCQCMQQEESRPQNQRFHFWKTVSQISS